MPKFFLSQQLKFFVTYVLSLCTKADLRLRMLVKLTANHDTV